MSEKQCKGCGHIFTPSNPDKLRHGFCNVCTDRYGIEEINFANPNADIKPILDAWPQHDADKA